jgi:glucose/arabinose dehydrogenase
MPTILRCTTSFLLLITLYNPLSAQIMLDVTEVDTATVIHGLDVPWEVQWGNDNHLWVTERYGRVSRIHPETGVQTVILDISASVYQQGEAGLLGMALHPDFGTTPQVFLVYTYVDGGVKEKLERYDYDGSQLVNPTVLLDNIPGNSTHNGSRLLVLPDNTLLMTTGDAQNQASAQNLNSLSGKTLRLHFDGSVPTDNPIAGSLVWSWGHRNAQGLLIAPNGKIYSAEHGPTTDDELNLLEKGGNFGWPNVHGYCDNPNETQFCNDSNVVEPLQNWTPTIAVSDISWYDHPSIPEFNGSILLTVLKDKKLVKLELDANGTAVVGQKDYFNNIWGRLRDICVGPDGTIYLATNGADWSNSDPFTHSIIAIKNTNHPTGDQDKHHPFSIKAWPNPGNNILHLTIPAQFHQGEISLHDTTGRELLRQKINQTNMNIPVEDLPSGIIQVIVRNGNAIKTTKVILAH